jgi:hypothetical protein
MSCHPPFLHNHTEHIIKRFCFKIFFCNITDIFQLLCFSEQIPNLYTVKEPVGIDSACLCSLAGRYDNPICRTGPAGYTGWQNRFFGIDSWAPLKLYKYRLSVLGWVFKGTIFFVLVFLEIIALLGLKSPFSVV